MAGVWSREPEKQHKTMHIEDLVIEEIDTLFTEFGWEVNICNEVVCAQGLSILGLGIRVGGWSWQGGALSSMPPPKCCFIKCVPVF